MKSVLKYFTGPLHWHSAANDLIVRLRQKVNRGLLHKYTMQSLNSCTLSHRGMKFNVLETFLADQPLAVEVQGRHTVAALA